jgi:hypothetical protein
MLPTEDLFVYVYVLIHDLIIARSVAIPHCPTAGTPKYGRCNYSASVGFPRS